MMALPVPMAHVSTIIPKNYFLDIKVYNKQKSLIIEGLAKEKIPVPY